MGSRECEVTRSQAVIICSPCPLIAREYSYYIRVAPFACTYLQDKMNSDK